MKYGDKQNAGDRSWPPRFTMPYYSTTMPFSANAFNSSSISLGIESGSPQALIAFATSFSPLPVTTVTTVMALVVIAVVTLIFNVTPIVTFVFPLIIGLLSGTYSSVCLVPCMWVMWQEYRAKKAQQTDAKKK